MIHQASIQGVLSNTEYQSLCWGGWTYGIEIDVKFLFIKSMVNGLVNRFTSRNICGSTIAVGQQLLLARIEKKLTWNYFYVITWSGIKSKICFSVRCSGQNILCQCYCVIRKSSGASKDHSLIMLTCNVISTFFTRLLICCHHLLIPDPIID